MLYLSFQYVVKVVKYVVKVVKSFTNSTVHPTDVWGTLGDELLAYSVTDLDNGRFTLLTLLLLSVEESLWGFLNYCASFNLCLLPTLSLIFNIFIWKSYGNTASSKNGEMVACISKSSNMYKTKARNALY